MLYPFLDIGRPVQNLGMREIELGAHELIGRGLEIVGTNHVVGQDKAGEKGQGQNSINDTLYIFFPDGIDKTLFGEVHKLYPQRGSETDEHAVDKKQIERSPEIVHITVCQTESGGTERGHQCRSDGHTGYYVPLLFGRDGDNSRQSTEKCNQYVVYGRAGTGEQLRPRFIQRGDQKVKRGGNDTENRGDGQIAERTLDQLEIVYAHRYP